MSKSMMTNLIAGTVLVIGIFLPDDPEIPYEISDFVLNAGLFAFSGAITNWLAVHMLFNKVPGLYGSGIIPNKFEAFKKAIHDMMMNQFFNKENIERFFSSDEVKLPFEIKELVEEADLNPAFDMLVKTIMESKFGSMLSMFGGASAIEPLREAFCNRMRQAIIAMVENEDVKESIKEKIKNSNVTDGILDNVSKIVLARLDELTPQMVKEMIEEMIHEHLGWLVIWGGVFGGLLGLIATLIQAFS